MLNENYEKLSDNEKERFTKVANYLLNKTFVLRETYEAKDKIGKISTDYRFIERNYDIFETFFNLAGYTISKDDSNGIIQVNNIFQTNIVRLDKFTTLMLLTLRQMYDLEQEKGLAKKVCFVSVSDIIVKMIDNKFITKKPTIKETSDALRVLIKHNVLARFDGDIESSSAIVTIYPTIARIVSNERINAIYNNLFKEEQSSNEEII